MYLRYKLLVVLLVYLQQLLQAFLELSQAF